MMAFQWPDLDRIEPVRDQQLQALNQALSEETLRHAKTRLLALHLLSLLVSKRNGDEPAPPIVITKEVVRTVVVVRRDRSKAPGTARAPMPSVKKRRQRSTIPADIGQRTGLARAIISPVLLRSGTILDPDGLSARHGDRAELFSDASWLMLCALVEAQDWVSAEDFNRLLYGGKASAVTIRSGIYRTNQTLDAVGPSGDIDSAYGVGWRLLLEPGVAWQRV